MVQCRDTIEMIERLNNIIGKDVKRLFLVVWPPYGENDLSQLDISAGYVFEDNLNELLIISTDKNDLTTPIIECRVIPEKHFEWQEFNRRMNRWMTCDDSMIIDTEFYEITGEEIFQNIVNQKVLDFEIVIVADENPIGVKMIFENDFVLSIPIIDGNTIETITFNKNDSLKNFASLGKVKFVSIKKNIL